MEVLSSISETLAGLVERVGPSVVRVEAHRRLPASGIVWTADGVIVTASHALERDEHIRVGLASGETVAAGLIGRDPSTDIAVLRAEASSLTTSPWADPNGLRVGHLVLRLGRPGRTIRASLGMIAAVADQWRAPTGAELERYVQLDAGLPRGFSGGPLVDAAGRIVGMNTSGLLRWAVLALPLPTLRRVIDTLLTYGRVRRGYLGIGAQPVRLPAGARTGPARPNLEQEAALLVVSVEPNSPAEQAGLLLGDVLLALDGEPVRFPDDLINMLGGDRIGATASARVLRGGAMLDLPVTIGERREGRA